MNIIFKRKSVRTYLDIDVDDASVEQIIRAGMAAPSAKNQRPWEFYVVRNKETLAKLATCTPYSRPVANAPVAIVACYRTRYGPGFRMAFLRAPSGTAGAGQKGSEPA